MNNFRYICLLFPLLFVGCGTSKAEVARANAKSLKSSGEIVGVLPDGREVVRYKLLTTESEKPHWLYIVGDTMTDNGMTDGKHPKSTVEVTVNGQIFVPLKENQ